MIPDVQEMNELRYDDWLDLRAKLLWCYDHEVKAPRMAREGDVNETAERRISGRLVPAGWSVEGFDNCAAWLVRSGWAEVQYADRTIHAGPGQWLVVGQGRRIQSFADPSNLLSIAFTAEWPDKTPLLKGGFPLVIAARDHPSLERKAKQLVRMVDLPSERWHFRKEAFGYRSFLDLNALWCGWLRLLLDVATGHGASLSTSRNIDSRVIEATRLLTAHRIDRPLDQQHLAHAVHVSLSQLIRLFQRDLQTTPRQYFEGRRLELARERLRAPRARVKEVAYGLGFKHLSHFSRWFKKQTGLSPRQFLAGHD